MPRVKVMKQGANLQRMLSESMTKMDPVIVRAKIPRLRKQCTAALRIIKLGVDTFADPEPTMLPTVLADEFRRSELSAFLSTERPAKEWYNIWYYEMFKKFDLGNTSFTAEDSITYYNDLVAFVGKPAIFSMVNFARYKQFYNEEDPRKPSIKWTWMVKPNFANKKILIWFDLVDVCGLIRNLNAAHNMKKVSHIIMAIIRLSSTCKNIRAIVVEEPNVDVGKIVESLSLALDQLEKQIPGCTAAFRTIRRFLPEFRKNFSMYNTKITESGGNTGTALEMILSDAAKSVDDATTTRQFNKIIRTLTTRFNRAVSEARTKDLSQQQQKNLDRASGMAKLIDDIVTGLDDEPDDDGENSDDSDDDSDDGLD